MIQIGDTIISLDIFEKEFCCDLAVCKGICCVEGDSGAPLEEGEAEQIRENYGKIKPHMKPEGIAAVEEQGFSVVDIEGDMVTPLIGGRECAYIIEENGCSWCAIEKAWSRGESSFRKPISCHMYPIRVKQYQNYEAMNYDQWTICACARLKGEQEGIPVYVFLKDALIRKYGEDNSASIALQYGTPVVVDVEVFVEIIDSQSDTGEQVRIDPHAVYRFEYDAGEQIARTFAYGRTVCEGNFSLVTR